MELVRKSRVVVFTDESLRRKVSKQVIEKMENDDARLLRRKEQPNTSGLLFKSSIVTKRKKPIAVKIQRSERVGCHKLELKTSLSVPYSVDDGGIRLFDAKTVLPFSPMFITTSFCKISSASEGLLMLNRTRGDSTNV